MDRSVARDPRRPNPTATDDRVRLLRAAAFLLLVIPMPVVGARAHVHCCPTDSPFAAPVPHCCRDGPGQPIPGRAGSVPITTQGDTRLDTRWRRARSRHRRLCPCRTASPLSVGRRADACRWRHTADRVVPRDGARALWDDLMIRRSDAVCLFRLATSPNRRGRSRAALGHRDAVRGVLAAAAGRNDCVSLACFTATLLLRLAGGTEKPERECACLFALTYVPASFCPRRRIVFGSDPHQHGRWDPPPQRARPSSARQGGYSEAPELRAASWSVWGAHRMVGAMTAAPRRGPLRPFGT
jgi:hypothetical protein